MIRPLVAATLVVVAVLPVASAQSLTPAELRQGYSNRTILAKPRTTLPAADVAAAEQREGRRARRVFSRFGNLRIVETARGETIADAIRQMRASGRYEFVEPDYIKHRHALPNDPRFVAGDQWALRNTGQQNGVAGADIGAVAAWDRRTDASSVTVAIIDTGIRATHEDLAANLWTNPREIPNNGIDDDNNGYVDDVHGINALVSLGSPSSGNNDDDVGHGTLVAGLIGAAGNNGKGIAGVAWQAKIMALKFDDIGGSATTSNEIECIDYAIANGARIINISYGTSFYSQSEFDAVKRARDAGVIVVVSAGNAGVSTDVASDFPTNFLLDNVVAVAATDRRDTLSTFSNYSLGFVDLAAPGTAILSTENTSDSAYGAHDGTSFSSPIVAGALAVLAAEYPAENYRSLMNRVFRSVDPLPALAGKVQTGGRLNLARALAADNGRPFNDDFAARVALTGPTVTIRANTRLATAETNEPAHAGIAAAGTLWWSWTAPSSGTGVVDTAGSGFDTVLGIYTGTNLASLTPVAANDDITGSLAARVSFSVTSGTTYQIAVGGKGTTTGAVVLSVGIAPQNDNFAAATSISGQSVRVGGFNTVAGSEFGEPRPATATGRSVWYKWVAPTTTDYSFSVFAFGFDAVAAVYTGSSLGGLSRIDTASVEFYNEPAYISAVAGRTYYFQVDSADGNTGLFTLAVVDAVAFPGFMAADPSPALDLPTGTLYLLDVFGLALSIDANSGTVKSATLTGGVDVQSPAIGYDAKMFVGDDVGYLYSYDRQLTRLWRKDLGLVRVTCSPAIAADGTIYVHTDDGQLHAYSAAGDLKWRAPVPGESYSSPSIGADGTIYIGSEDENLYALSPLDGALKWKFKANGEIYTSPAIDANGAIYFGTLNGKLYSVSSGGAQRWSFTAGGPISSSPTLGLDGTVYFGCYDRNLYAVTSTGTLRWTFATGDEIRASTPAVASNGVIYIGSYDGLIYAVNSIGTLLRTYATGGYIRSSPAIYDGALFIGSGDTRTYILETGVNAANSPWPMHRQNAARTGRRAVVTAPVIASLSTARSPANGDATSVAINAGGAGPMTFAWQVNGTTITGATDSSYMIASTTSAQTGIYSGTVTNSLGSASTGPLIVGLSTNLKVVGAGSEVGTDIAHPNGNIFDQVLLQGAAASVTADPNQVLRISYIDRNDDIVQVEFAGAGTLSLVLDGPTGPAAPVNYNQALGYMKGHVGIVVTGANETTNLSVFSVGRGNAVNQALFKDNVTYDGRADIAFIAITSTNGKFGGLRTSNAIYNASKGVTGVYAPGVEFTGPLFVGNISAQDNATPYLVIGSGSNVRVTGGDMLQANNRAVVVAGITQLQFAAGVTSHYVDQATTPTQFLPAKNNRARYEQNGVDVTAQIVVNPTP